MGFQTAPASAAHYAKMCVANSFQTMPIGEKPQMTTSQAGAARICGEQDCNERTNRPNHPLCYQHYLAFQADDIDECPNHPGVYKPSEYDICRSCYSQRRQPAQSARTTDRQQPQDDSRGWNRQPTPEVKPASPSVAAAAAVNRVRQNMTAYKRECENHETSTIQFLITPMLRGLGWDFDDPNQVRAEYSPEDKRRFGQIRVDIALFGEGSPRVFIEAKRLDREYDHGYLEQLGKYASFLREGGIAVLTNGKFWQVYSVENGKTDLRRTIDVAGGDAETVARELHNVIGREVISNSSEKIAPSVPDEKPNPPATVEHPPTHDGFVGSLEHKLLIYRRECYQDMMRRGQRPYYVLNDETIERIVAQRPTDLRQLENIQGVYPSTLQRHGGAILKIVRGEA